MSKGYFYSSVRKEPYSFLPNLVIKKCVIALLKIGVILKMY